MRVEAPLQIVHRDLAGSVGTEPSGGHRYAQLLPDDYSGAVFLYFLKKRSDTVQATERFLADVPPFGDVNVSDQKTRRSLHAMSFKHDREKAKLDMRCQYKQRR